eukprot:14763301-Ditylum_brightwellii.AAC.1
MSLKKSEDLLSSEEKITTLNERDAEQKKQIAAGKRNALAMAHLSMALGTESMLNKVSNVSDENWPGGLAY